MTTEQIRELSRQHAMGNWDAPRLSVSRVATPPKPRTVYLPPDAPRTQSSMRAAKERAGRPRTRPLKEKRTSGSGVRNPALTVERILALRSEGKSQSEIAGLLGCQRSAISKCLERHAAKSPELAAELAAARLCACGRGKHGSSETCRECKRLVTRKAERAARRKG